MDTLALQDDWGYLKKFLPSGWETQATTLGALVRKKKFQNAETLLRVLLIHLIDGKSLRATSAYAKEAKLCDVNDVSLLKRLRASSEWFRWISSELIKDLKGPKLPYTIFQKYRVRVVDGSVINEPGATGTDWRIHYSFSIANLACDTFKITDVKTGECLQRFPIEEEDLIIGDRAYCKRIGIKYVLQHGGEVLLRYNSGNVPLLTRNGKPWETIKHLKILKEGQVGDKDVWIKDPESKQLIKGRFCFVKKSKEAAEKAIKKLKKNASKKQRKIKPETLVFAKYVCIFTTLTRHKFKKDEILLMYRGRWQIELAFKRLKSLLGLGCLPKYHEESCIAWLHGKMLIALLIERIHQEADFFSPWGYPIGSLNRGENQTNL